MTNAIILDNGKLVFLKNLLLLAGGLPIDGLAVRLYTNNHTPAHGDLIGAYTEAAFAGYVNGSIGGESPVVLDGAFNAVSTAAAIAFNNATGVGQNVFGIFITDAGGTVAYAAGIFTAAPLTIPAGGTLVINLSILLNSMF